MCVSVQVQSEFILESERESFIEQVREVIENADERGLDREHSNQVNIFLSHSLFIHSLCMMSFLSIFIVTFPLSH